MAEVFPVSSRHEWQLCSETCLAASEAASVSSGSAALDGVRQLSGCET